jgi:alpha-N-arabinofuranosidase
MASYAPLFAREQMFQWRPDLIWFDSSRITTLTPSYYIQKYFANNIGTKTLPPERIPSHNVIFHASSIDAEKGYVYTKLVNPYQRNRRVTVNYANMDASEAAMTLLSGKPADLNVTKAGNTVPVVDNAITLDMEAYTTVILKIKMTGSSDL